MQLWIFITGRKFVLSLDAQLRLEYDNLIDFTMFMEIVRTKKDTISSENDFHLNEFLIVTLEPKQILYILQECNLCQVTRLAVSRFPLWI